MVVEPDLTSLREAAKGIVQRAREDAAFAAHLRADPHATLIAAGLPEPAVDDFMSEVGMEPDVTGFMNRECTYSCLITDTGDCQLTHGL
jgi:hypothetical protein